MADDIGRPVDEIAGGMDGRGRSFPETLEWMLDQLLTAEKGLRAVTVEAAHALRDEARRGHLAAGTLGDVTILSGNVLDATADEICAFNVVATIVGGEVVYCSDAATAEAIEHRPTNFEQIPQHVASLLTAQATKAVHLMESGMKLDLDEAARAGERVSVVTAAWLSAPATLLCRALSLLVNACADQARQP